MNMLKAMYLFFFNFLAELEGLKPCKNLLRKKEQRYTARREKTEEGVKNKIKRQRRKERKESCYKNQLQV